MEIGGVEHGWTDEGFERRKRQAQARLRLAFLKRHDRIVEAHDLLVSRGDLSGVEIAARREMRRQEYRRATGVEIEQCDELKSALQGVIATGERSMEEAVEELRTRYAKRLSLADGTFGASGDGGSGVFSRL